MERRTGTGRHGTAAAPGRSYRPLLALAAPAFAAPRQCSVVCTCNSSCAQLCSDGPYLSNCFDGGICVGQCFAANTSVGDEKENWNAIFGAPQEAPASEAPAPAIH